MDLLLKILGMFGLGKIEGAEKIDREQVVKILDMASTVVGVVNAVLMAALAYVLAGGDIASLVGLLGLGKALSSAVQGYLTNKKATLPPAAPSAPAQ